VAFAGLFFPFAASNFVGPGRVGVKLVVGLVYLVALASGWRKGPPAARLWLVLGLGIPYVLSYGIHAIYVWYRYPIIVYPAFMLLTVAGAKALPGRIGRGFAVGLFVTYGMAGCWSYFTVWQKANPQAVAAFVDNLETASTVIVRPAYFADLFSYYHRGNAPVIDEDQLDSPAKRAALKGQTILLAEFDTPSDPVGEALRSSFRIVTSKNFPGFAHLGITVYELR
jgi:hypothetical protein